MRDVKSVEMAKHAKPCTHPAIVFRNGKPYCSECGAQM